MNKRASYWLVLCHSSAQYYFLSFRKSQIWTIRHTLSFPFPSIALAAEAISQVCKPCLGGGINHCTITSCVTEICNVRLPPHSLLSIDTLYLLIWLLRVFLDRHGNCHLLLHVKNMGKGKSGAIRWIWLHSPGPRQWFGSAYSPSHNVGINKGLLQIAAEVGVLRRHQARFAILLW